MEKYYKFLSGGDLRSISKANELIPFIETQDDFDELFKYIFSDERLIAMRSIDAVEKITIKKPDYLVKHKPKLIGLLDKAINKEFKWHLALIITRIKLSSKDFQKVYLKLSEWAMDKSESSIVRVNSIQSLYNLLNKHQEIEKDFELILKVVQKENIPSINARIRKLELKSKNNIKY